MTMQENRIQRKIGQMCAKKQMRHIQLNMNILLGLPYARGKKRNNTNAAVKYETTHPNEAEQATHELVLIAWMDKTA